MSPIKVISQSFQAMKKPLRKINYWITPFVDIKKCVRAPYGYCRFVGNYLDYRNMNGAEPLRLTNMRPSLSDWNSKTAFDSHYIYLNAWAFRKICSNAPKIHIDVGSQISFVTTLSTIIPTIFIDVRPLEAKMDGLECRKGNILSMPFDDGEVASVSSLHVIEHIGLGRYGDALDPYGTQKAVRELARILMTGGSLYIGLPIGKPRVCFNAYRVHEPAEMVAWFSAQGLTLRDFSAVNDEGNFLENIRCEDMRDQEYACGMYHFVRE